MRDGACHCAGETKAGAKQAVPAPGRGVHPARHRSIPHSHGSSCLSGDPSTGGMVGAYHPNESGGKGFGCLEHPKPAAKVGRNATATMGCRPPSFDRRDAHLNREARRPPLPLHDWRSRRPHPSVHWLGQERLRAGNPPATPSRRSRGTSELDGAESGGFCAAAGARRASGSERHTLALRDKFLRIRVLD
jgi:hypothetical protein